MRYSWLVLLVATPGAAQEYQVDLTGTTTSGSPFTATFEVSATPVELSLDPSNCQFGGILTVTNLSVAVGGNSLFTVPRTNDAVFNGASSSGGACGLMRENFGVGVGDNGLAFQLEANGVNSFSSPNPVLAILTSWQTATPEGGDIDPGHLGIGTFKLSVAAVSAPEPDTLALMSLGLLGILIGRRLSARA